MDLDQCSKWAIVILALGWSTACSGSRREDPAVAGRPGHTGGGGGQDAAGGVGGTGGAEGGAGGSAGLAENVGGRAGVVATVDYAAKRQRMDGFGIATAWGAHPPDAQLEAFFSTTKGAGLSILRNRIPFREAPANNDNFMGGGNYTFTTVNAGTANEYKRFTLNWGNWDLAGHKALIAKLKSNPDYAVSTFFSTPWTPPNNATSKWKVGVADYTSAPEVGGSLDPARYRDYADVLADYVLGFEANMGVPLAALSLQNEPNYKVTYESADWTAQQFHEFLVVLKGEFTKKGVFAALPKLTIMAPEDANFKEELILPSLADADTAPLIGIVGVHQYEFGPWNVDQYAPEPLAQAGAAGKPVWVTEWNTSAFSQVDEFGRALLLARLLQMDFAFANVSAYVHWWYHDLVDDADVPNKSLWALGQFGRFVRPGWHRVEAPARVASGVLISAFKNAADTELAVVALNESDRDVALTVELASGSLGPTTVYRTSATENLAQVGVAASAGAFVNVTAKAKSLSTFVAPVSR